jgi:hypothetical protein
MAGCSIAHQDCGQTCRVKPVDLGRFVKCRYRAFASFFVLILCADAAGNGAGTGKLIGVLLAASHKAKTEDRKQKAEIQRGRRCFCFLLSEFLLCLFSI